LCSPPIPARFAIPDGGETTDGFRHVRAVLARAQLDEAACRARHFTLASSWPHCNAGVTRLPRHSRGIT
jgi:hypothetical protein